MKAKRFPIFLTSVFLTLLSMVACTSGLATVDHPSQFSSIPTNVLNNEPSSTDKLVDITPMTSEELASEPEAQTEPAASIENTEKWEESVGQESPIHSTDYVTYTDSIYQFSIAFPSDYTFNVMPHDQLVTFNPAPAAAFTIMNPTTAASEVAELEPADVALYVFNADQVGSLNDLLVTLNLTVGGSSSTPFQAVYVSGLEVCNSSMIAPGCSYFVEGSGWIYRLIPATLEGEAIIDTLMLITK